MAVDGLLADDQGLGDFLAVRPSEISLVTSSSRGVSGSSGDHLATARTLEVVLTRAEAAGG